MPTNLFPFVNVVPQFVNVIVDALVVEIEFPVGIVQLVVSPVAGLELGIVVVLDVIPLGLVKITPPTKALSTPEADNANDIESATASVAFTSLQIIGGVA